MTVRLLTRDEFIGAFNAPMKRIERDDSDELWEYVDSIVLSTLDIVALGDIERVYRDATGRYDHCLLWTDRDGRYLDIVWDVGSECVYGHHVVDLDAEHGALN